MRQLNQEKNQEKIANSRAKRKEIEAIVLARTGISTREIEAAVGLTRSTVRRHLAALQGEGKVECKKNYVNGSKWSFVWYPVEGGDQT